MTNIEILDNLELDINDFFKKKHINAYNIDSWTDKKSERTFNYTYEIKSNKKQIAVLCMIICLAKAIFYFIIWIWE